MVNRIVRSTSLFRWSLSLATLITAATSRELRATADSAATDSADDDAPVGYVCGRASAPLVMDGRLDEADWRAAPWTADFRDIEGAAKPAPRFRTRVKMLWDDQRLYLAAELAEPHVQGTFTKRDSYGSPQ